MSAGASSTSVATRPDDPKTVLYYRLRSAISDGNEAGVCQILKLRSMSSKVWLKLCPHLLWDKIEPMQTDSIQTMWFDILGTELEDYLEDSLLTLACNLGHQSIACVIIDAVKAYAYDIPCARCKITPSALFEKEGPNGHSPLQICAQKGLMTVVKKLLDAGCYVNRKGLGVYRTALHYATQNGQIEVALLLLKCGANPNDSQCDPLTGESEHFRRSLDAAPPFSILTVPSPFSLAIELGHDRIVEAMLSTGRCDPNSFYDENCGVPKVRPLSFALGNVVGAQLENRFRIVKLLLQHGATVANPDTVLAMRWPSAEVLAELLKHGADPNSTFGLWKSTLLHSLCSETVSDRMAKVEALVDAKVDPNAKDVNGDVAFHQACFGYLRQTILRLARIPGINVNAVNSEGISPLMRLLSSQNLPQDTQEIVSLLEAVPFDFSLKDKNGRNMFCYAAMSQALDLLNYLVRKGVNPQSVDNLGNSPFIYALCCGHLKVAAGLVCLTKNLSTDWKLSHASIDILNQQEQTMSWFHSSAGRPEQAYLEVPNEPLLQLGLVHGLLSLQNPSYTPRTPSRLPVPVESIKGYEVSLFIKALLSKNYDVNIRNSKGETALCMLLKQKHWHTHLKVSVVVLLLLEHGADPDIAAIPPPSVFQDVSERDRRQFRVFFHDHGDLPWGVLGLNEPKTPMDHALESRNVHVATYLYLAGARLIRSRHHPFLRDMELRHLQLQEQTRGLEASAQNGDNGQNAPQLLPNNVQFPPANFPQPPPLPPNHPPPDQVIHIPALGGGAAAENDAEDENRVPPSLRRRRSDGKEGRPCVYFTPPHRCIVCLTQIDAPSLAILARRAVRYALRGQLQHCHKATQLGIPNNLFDFLKMIDFD